MSCRVRWCIWVAIPEQEGGGDRRGVGEHLREGAGGEQAAALFAGAGADVHEVVGLADDGLVVLDDEHRVAALLQAAQRQDEPAGVARVQAHRRLVEDVADAEQPAAEMRGEPRPLRLTARQRRRGPIERQVAEPDLLQESQPLGDLRENRLANAVLAMIVEQAREEYASVIDGKRRDLVQTPAFEAHGAGLAIQPGPGALGADFIRDAASVALVRIVIAGSNGDAGGVAHGDRAEAAATWTPAVGIVEVEPPRLRIGDRGAAARTFQAGAVGKITPFAGVDVGENDAPLTMLDGRLQRLVQPFDDGWPQHEPIHHHLDGVPGPGIELRRVADFQQYAVHAGPQKAALPNALKNLGMPAW